MTDLHDFYLMLEMHDWNYEYSDDHRVWKIENEKRRQLEKIAGESVKHMKLYDMFLEYETAPPAQRKFLRRPDKPRERNAPISLRS